ncbi:hypothetical protein TNCV_2432891 [Trichonephila clavipes]|nr:hypothetical protein TNCV_2432891 [Trichonephila clavipes]
MPSPVQSNCDAHDTIANGQYGAVWSMEHTQQIQFGDCGSPVVKVSDHGWHVMSSSPVPLKTRRVGQRCTLNPSRAETSSRWCGS